MCCMSLSIFNWHYWFKERQGKEKEEKEEEELGRGIFGIKESITSIASIALFLLHNFLVFVNGQVRKQYLACSKLIVCIYLYYRYKI